MWIRRPQNPLLRPLVRTLWLSAGSEPRPAREWVLPTGTIHIVFRLGDEPLRLFRDLDDAEGWQAGLAIVGGPRASAYLRDISRPAPSIGAQLSPGALPLLLGVPASELADRHVALDDLLGRRAHLVREELLGARSPTRKLEIFESFLASRLSTSKELHPAVVMAIRRLDEQTALSDIIADSGYSHRHFIALFRHAIGLSPKLYARILRFQRSLEAMRSSEGAPLARIASMAGYSDQPHWTREFRELSGLSPSVYRALAPESPNHVQVVNFLQDATECGRQSGRRLSDEEDPHHGHPRALRISEGQARRRGHRVL